MATELVPGVTADSKVAFGKPVIAGTRTPVAVVLAQLAAGTSEDVLRDEYDLSGEQIRAAIRYGAWQEPVERYGTLDAGFRDPSGNGWKMRQAPG